MTFTHDDLVRIAERWLARSPGYHAGKDGRGQCNFVLTEAGCWMSAETPDAIGWYGGWTFLVECKATRSDFLADAKKSFRQTPEHGVGDFRYYLTTDESIIAESDVPEKWGLLHLTPRGRVLVIKHAEPHKEKSLHAENELVIAALRRIIYSPKIEGVRINLNLVGRERKKTAMTLAAREETDHD